MKIAGKGIHRIPFLRTLYSASRAARSRASSSTVFPGAIRFNRKDMTPATTTGLDKRAWARVGKFSRAAVPSRVDSPIARAMETPTMVLLRAVRGSLDTNLSPVRVIIPNTMRVPPPMTGAGSVDTSALNLGTTPREKGRRR